MPKSLLFAHSALLWCCWLLNRLS